MANQDKDTGTKRLKSGNRSFGGGDVDLNSDIERMRANFEANPFKYVNGNGVLLKEQVVGEDGQVYESEEAAEQSEIEHERIEDFNRAWATSVGDMLDDALEYGFGNDVEDFVVLSDLEETISFNNFGNNGFGNYSFIDESYDMFDTSQIPVEDLLHVDYDQAMQNAVNNTPNVFSPFGTFGGSPIETNIDPTAAFAAAAAPPPAQPAEPEATADITAEAANDATFEEKPTVTTPQAVPAPAF